MSEWNDISPWNQLPEEWRSIEDIYKFGIEEAGPGSLSNIKVFVDAGISVKAKQGSELKVFAGAFPLTITISAAFLQDSFDPQYPTSRYQRERVFG